MDLANFDDSTGTAELVSAAVTGDRCAFELLVTRHAGIVTGTAFSVCGDFARSEDVGQEAFVEAWKNLATLREPHQFVAWVCTIARRRAVDAIRSSRQTQSFETLSMDLADRKQPTPEVRMSQDQDRELVWSILERLPEAYREPMVLYYRSEQSTRDVAIAMGENEATIRQRLKRGREMLRAEVTEALRSALCETIPQATFAAMVVAALPSSSYAAAATSAATVASKSTGFGSVSATVAGSAAYGALGAVVGTSVGLLGGIFGTWMGWKNCEYKSQQKFIVREAVIYLVVFAIFSTLLMILIHCRSQGFIESNNVYAGLLIGLIFGFQGFNLLWIWRSIRVYKRLGEEARANGEPVREPVQQRMERMRQRTQVVRPDGSTGFDPFRWNASDWFGGSMGSICWMLPLSAIAFWHNCIFAGTTIAVCLFLGIVLSFTIWKHRTRISAYHSYQLHCWWTFALSLIVFAAEQFAANPAAQKASSWTSWGWFLLVLFPVVSFRLHRTRQSFEHEMRKRSTP